MFFLAVYGCGAVYKNRSAYLTHTVDATYNDGNITCTWVIIAADEPQEMIQLNVLNVSVLEGRTHDHNILKVTLFAYLFPISTSQISRIKNYLPNACADLEGKGAGCSDSLKNHKNIGYLSNTDPDPLKSQRYHVSIQS